MEEFKNKKDEFKNKRIELEKKYNQPTPPTPPPSNSNLVPQNYKVNSNIIDIKSDNTANEVAELEKELGDLNELLGDSTSNSSLEEEINEELLEEYQRNLQNSNLEEINSGIVDMVNKLSKADSNIENTDISENQNYKKNNLSELDELAYVEPDRNSELNELIGDNNEYVNSLESNINSTPEKTNCMAADDITSSNIELSLSDEHNSEYNIEEKNVLKEDIEYEVLAREFLQKDLREKCKNYNLSMKGNKKDLLERIAEAGYLNEILNKDKNINVSKN